MKEYLELKKLGKDCFFKRDFDNAIRYYSQAILINPRDPNLYGLRCTSYNKIMRFDLALEDVEKMLKSRPLSYKGYLMKANCLTHLNEFDQAIEAYGKVY